MENRTLPEKRDTQSKILRNIPHNKVAHHCLNSRENLILSISEPVRPLQLNSPVQIKSRPLYQINSEMTTEQLQFIPKPISSPFTDELTRQKNPLFL